MIDDTLAEALGRYVVMCQCPATPPEQAAQDFFSILRRPFLTSVFVKFDPDVRRFGFFTEHVYIEHAGECYSIGEFVVLVELDQHRHSTITAFNVTEDQQLGGHRLGLSPHGGNEQSAQHPHVNGSGQFCINDEHKTLYTAAQSGRMVTVVDILWTGLSGYNPDSPYLYIENWPRLMKLEQHHAPDNDRTPPGYLPRTRLAVSDLRARLRRRGEPRLALPREDAGWDGVPRGGL